MRPVRNYVELEPTEGYPLGVIFTLKTGKEVLWTGGFDSFTAADKWGALMKERYPDYYEAYRVVKVETPEVKA